ncbi:MAG: (Fe-S)-binding protein [Deltaproteobacteria bacterium]|nr:(Fe-S)-binding protein [Deltaproteobacteria bacterium]
MKPTPDRQELTLCAFCPDLCLARCPVSLASGDLTLSPWAKQSLLWRHLQGEPWGGADGRSTRPLFMCLGCLACQELCRHRVDVPSSLFAGRDLAHREAPELRPRSPRASGAADRLRLLAPGHRWAEDTEALLLVEGLPLDAGGEAWLREVFEALDVLGDEVVGVNADAVLETGWRSWEAGDLPGAEAAARRLHARLGRYRRVLAVSPEAASFVRRGWPAWGLNRPEVLPLTDHLAAAADRLTPLRRAPRTAWHDPCHLARHLGAAEAPRRLLAALLGDRLVELPRNRRDAVCCGGGGGMEVTAPELCAAMAAELLTLFEETGARRLATGCPRCQRTLEAAAPGKVISLYRLIAEARP